MTITIVAAIAANGVIGRGGDLPWRLPADLRHFKKLTYGHVLVMGRRTYESIGHPLPGRTTVVVSRRATPAQEPVPDPTREAVITASSVQAALARALEIDDEVFVVGGAQVYAAALEMADRMVLTLVDEDPEGDTWFPAVDWSVWRETQRELSDGLAFVTYERV
ncbi:MAG: dihydrofolate reductase [Nocardioidaceae bacterium]